MEFNLLLWKKKIKNQQCNVQPSVLGLFNLLKNTEQSSSSSGKKAKTQLKYICREKEKDGWGFSCLFGFVFFLNSD